MLDIKKQQIKDALRNSNPSIIGNIDLKKYAQSLKKNGLLLQSFMPREGIAHVFPTASSPFLAQLKASVGLSVLGQLDITKKTLHAMGVQELNLLSIILLKDMSEVDREIKRRG